MNLTISSLESMGTTVDNVLDSGVIESNTTLIEEYCQLRKSINGCLSLLNDLSTCAESLKQCGYSQEWLDIVNKDNKFLALCNIEMPKFFGGDYSKGKACMEGIMDTIIEWSKKAWEVLKKIFAWLMGACSAIMDMFQNGLRKGTKSFGDLERMWNAFQKKSDDVTRDINGKKLDPITFPSTQVLNIYFTKLMLLIDRVNSKLESKEALDCVVNAEIDRDTHDRYGNTGVPEMDVYSLIASCARECNIKYRKDEDGFICTNQGIEFMPVDGIKTITVDLRVDRELVGKAITALAGIRDNFDDYSKIIGGLQKRVKAYQSKLQQYYDSLKKKSVINENPALTARAIKRAKTIYEFLVSVMRQLSCLYNAGEQTSRLIAKHLST